ncbi:alpha-amylase family glycosyl hydrolase [Microlunatus flavus]|uniref:Sucrose phosphorylase n=1 Tax=Microlunatus flavus TaxID=1036181 RepID=A0A1H9FG91_9ACTN|nr:alpha-amylase family glycosyl hydrolase [Microlunatus flavus]SEQ36845.1 sucrose phosphorylase [Microlunatus flavus]
MSDLAARLEPLVARLYPGQVQEVTTALVRLAQDHAGSLAGRRTTPLDESTAVLITYADSVRRPDQAPLQTLGELLDDEVGGVVTDVHLLPMYPWTSDDGFGVVDHRAVDPALGTWDDVARLAGRRTLWFDFVANHTSSASAWFRGWLAGEAGRAGYYLADDAAFDTSRVVRPRTTPLFHPFPAPDGHVVRAWTTFGPDQVDVDVRTPTVLLELTDVLLGYVARGAGAVRLDAIGFLWKESGTTCLHLPQTHTVIRVWRALLDAVAPGTRLLTETNVPHAENVSYFGDGTDEAHLVYQFALPPLVLHAFVAGSVARLREWAATIGPVGPDATWFNFLASHDGIGLRPTEGILDDAERSALVERVLAHGGRVGLSRRPDGSESVYELNLTYLDALCTPAEAADPALLVAKGLAAHAILLTVVGVPAVYVHSLLGTRPDLDGMAASGINRRVNRPVLDADALGRDLRADHRVAGMFDGVRRLLAVRREQAALSPFAGQETLDLDDRVFAVRRTGGGQTLDCLTNVTAETVTLAEVSGRDLLTGRRVGPLTLGPHGFAWVEVDRA